MLGIDGIFWMKITSNNLPVMFSIPWKNETINATTIEYVRNVTFFKYSLIGYEYFAGKYETLFASSLYRFRRFNNFITAGIAYNVKSALT